MANDTGPQNSGLKNTETKPTRVKKSETLEVRIPYETKQAFLNACREDGTTASEVVREKVQDYLDTRERPSVQPDKRTLIMKLPQPIRRYGWRAAAGGVAAIGFVGIAALPSAAAPDFKAQFGRLDKNGDGVISVEEFIDVGASGSSKEARNVVIESRITTDGPDDADVKTDATATVDIKRDAFTFWLPEEIGGSAKSTETKQSEFKFIRSSRTTTGDDASTTSSHTTTFSLDDLRKDEFAEIDTNKDGKVSLAEFQTRQTAMLTRGFEMLDSNSDKALSEEEYARIVAPPMIRVKVSDDVKSDMPEMPKVEIPGMTVSPEAVKAAFTRLDVNKDGKLTLQEYLPTS